MTKLIGLLLLGGIYLLVAGGYDIFIQVGSFKKPEEISIAELEQDIPWNRHLVLTGGRPLFECGVVYYRTRRSQKIDGSEVYFIPIQDGQLTEYRSLTPRFCYG